MVVDLTYGNVVYADYGRRFPIPFKTSELKEVEQIFRGLPPGMEPCLWTTGREYFQKGFFTAAKEAEAIFSLGHYLFYGDPSQNIDALGFGYEEQRDWIVEQILTEDKPAAGNSGSEKMVTRRREWKKRASYCIPPVISCTETSVLKASVVALSSFNLTAPSREDAQHVERVLKSLREELEIRTMGPQTE